MPPTGAPPASLAAAVAALYAAISFPEGSRPDLGRLRACFLPDARLVRVTPGGVEAMDVDPLAGG